MPTRFILPICAISVAQASDTTSWTPPEENSLSRNEPELGASEGARRRIDTVNGVKLVVSAKMWGNGFRLVDGIECESVGEKCVGGSYLYFYQRLYVES